MSKVRLKDIKYNYADVALKEEQAEKIGIHLRKIYSYIDENVNMGRRFKYGNAYKAIRERAKRISGRQDVRFSKKEVAALINYKTKRFGHDEYVKIPYKVDYIFRAIFEIVDELKQDCPFPAEIEICVGKIRRECFYDIQSHMYEDWYKQDKRSDLEKNLLDDMFARKTTISKKF